MKLKLVFASATALGLLMASAYADDNVSEISQSGDQNKAAVTQSGDGNDAGSPALAMRQLGNLNQLTVTQSGDGNSVGLETNVDSAEAGIYQATPATGARGNRLTITQSSNSNVVGAISQVKVDPKSGNTANVVTIVQQGGDDNRVGTIYQRRGDSAGNSALITQTGHRNTVERVYQNNGDTSGINHVVVEITGHDNGRGVLTEAALASGAVSSHLYQQPDRNIIRLTIEGNLNEFGVTQSGLHKTSNPLELNTADIVINGSSNQVGVNQLGGKNDVVATVVGSSNNLGIRQSGSGQNGQRNEAIVDISGNSNGGGDLAGEALNLANANGLVSGLIDQYGNDNTAELFITGSDNNQFALLQRGNGNSITGSVSGAGSNSATHVQIGNNNASGFSQAGLGNQISVSQ